MIDPVTNKSLLLMIIQQVICHLSTATFWRESQYGTLKTRDSLRLCIKGRRYCSISWLHFSYVVTTFHVPSLINVFWCRYYAPRHKLRYSQRSCCKTIQSLVKYDGAINVNDWRIGLALYHRLEQVYIILYIYRDENDVFQALNSFMTGLRIVSCNNYEGRNCEQDLDNFFHLIV